MKMKVLKNEKRLCLCCMESHNVQTVRIKEENIYKGCNVFYDAEYMYCDKADELYSTENQIQQNDISMKNAYRQQHNLLTSDAIVNIRAKYGITQNDLCVLLGWGEKTVTRYEGHQVQDAAHDKILKKIDADPSWFIELLKNARDNFPEDTYRKYYERAMFEYENQHDVYLRKTIEALYAKFSGKPNLYGNAELALDKVVDVIKYFAASTKVTVLYKVKLVKMLWYADFLSYKDRGFSITGLVYQSLPMGAVPVGHDYIIWLKGVPCQQVEIGNGIGYLFKSNEELSLDNLTQDDIKYLDIVINKFGRMSKDEIVKCMHKEEAYGNTKKYDYIDYSYASSILS